MIRKSLVGLVLLVLLLAAWQYQRPGGWAAWRAAVPGLSGLPGPAGMPGPSTAPQAPMGVHKCQVGGTVTYSDAPCAQAGTERAMGGGSVTVVPAQRPPTSATVPGQAASLPHVRELLLDSPRPNEPSLLDKQIDRAVNQ